MPANAKLPHFIIAGAQKSGTTSLHHILASHPDIFIPEKEVFFFDVDDIVQHPDFFIPTSDGWVTHDFEADFDTYFEWYQQVFAAAGEDQLIGEDSTTYLASARAAERIARVLPDARILILLRNPVDRAYSHYWHRVRTSRATRSFEATVRHLPGNMLSRGFYKEQLERYFQAISREQIKVVIFEEFVQDTQRIVDEVCKFIGVSGTVDTESVNSHRNKARPPFSLPLRLMINRRLGRILRPGYNKRIPGMPDFQPPQPQEQPQDQEMDSADTEQTSLTRKMRSLIPRRSYPPMKADTREFLTAVFAERNRGLSELLGLDLEHFWPGQGS